MAIRRCLPTLLALAALLASVAAEADAPSTRFSFAPRDGEVWIEKLVDIRTTDPGGDAALQKEHTTEVDTLLFAKQGEGWRVTRIMGPARMEVSGQPFDNPILKISRGTHIELSCDENGVAHEVRGFRLLLRKLERSLSPEVWAKYQSSVTLQGVQRTEMRRWNLRRGGLIGAEAQDGEIWNFQSFFPSSMGYLDVRGTIRFGGMIDFEGRRGYKLFLDFATGSKDLTSKDATKEVDLRPAGYTSSNSNEYGLEGSTVRVIDPTTGHMLYENTKVSWKVPEMRGGEKMVGKTLQMTYRLEPLSQSSP
jgi:hypothetical protein